MTLPTSTILCGDVIEKLKQLPAGSVHCCVTSPPYWKLRNYGVDGQIGLEPTPEAFVAKMVELFAEVRRVLRDDGVLWLNLGDSYQDKNLLEMPSEVVRALKADGWYQRSRIPWLKRNPMPESCTDRPTTAVEYIFLLAKSAKYFYDGEAIRGKQSCPIKSRRFSSDGGADARSKGQKSTGNEGSGSIWTDTGTRNRRNSDWFFESWQGLLTDGEGPIAMVVNPYGYKEAHFATFPEKLVEPCVLAGTSEKGCCPECGKPWVRVVEIKDPEGRLGKGYRDHKDDLVRGQRGVFPANGAPTKQTLGFRPDCECSDGLRMENRWCPAKHYEIEGRWEIEYIATGTAKPPIPCTVLDPFMGSGTTSAVALRLKRSAIGIELNPEYCKLAEDRIAQSESAIPAEELNRGQIPLFADA